MSTDTAEKTADLAAILKFITRNILYYCFNDEKKVIRFWQGCLPERVPSPLKRIQTKSTEEM